ncbi:MAG: hypothetical protein RMM06_02420 [Armatimonadota bacterium]|nr:hypothetical protein [bacterium]MCS7310393.1 hypothetical protein [Armatimonadota bacterium]MDW8289552.1 hypothetical protein [Armatimonadota bacterium]
MNWRQVTVALAATVVVATIAWAQLSPDTGRCMNHMRQALRAVQAYMQDYDEMFPPATNPTKLLEAIGPYLKDNKTALTCPVTGKPYRTNPHISWRPKSNYPNLGEVVVLFDSAPHKDKRYVVGFADGTVKAVTEKELAAIKQKARLK